MLEVLLHDQAIGILVREGDSGIIRFELDDSYLYDAHRAVLGQQFEERRQHRVFRQAAMPGRLPSYFANLLPEGALRDIIDAQRPAGDDMVALEFVGPDLPGAVMIRPASQRPLAPSSDVSTFDEPHHAVKPAAAGALHFSLAGNQLKFSAVREEQRFTLPFSGLGGRWIVKFDSAAYPQLPENEYYTMLWAAKSGLNIPRIELLQAESFEGLDERMLSIGKYIFAIERYDRLSDGTRIHQEDMAQVKGIPPIPPEHKYRGASYEGLARFIGDLCGREDLEEFIRRVIFNLLAGNTDAHLKNWSLIYPDGRAARLAPAYDLVFVRQYFSEDFLALPLAKEKDPTRIGWEHIKRLERYLRDHGHDLAVVEISRDFVVRCLDAWREIRDSVHDRYRARMAIYQTRLQIQA